MSLRALYCFFTFFLNGIAVFSGCGGGGGTTASMVSGAVSGVVSYEDKELGPIPGTDPVVYGFTGNLLIKPVRHARVEVVDGTYGTVLASGATGTDGRYSLSYTSREGSAVYVRVAASVDIPDKSPVEIRNNKYSSLPIYAVTAAVSASLLDITIPITSSAAGAFNLLDVFTAAGDFVHSLSGTHPPLLKAYWHSGSYDGTYYSPGDGIFIYGYAGDPDEYDDDVLWHEYGHFIADKYSKDDSPGGWHSLNQNDQDLRLSWSEGWGNFFPCAVKTWLAENNPALLSTTSGMTLSIYVDTVNGSSWSFNFGDPPSSHLYSSSEVAVAKVLWDLMSDVSFGMQSIWKVVDEFIPATTYNVNLEVFWDGLRAHSNPDATSIFAARQIHFREDSLEPDDSISSAAQYSAGQMRYLYKADGTQDKDFIAFTATGVTYTIQTYGLTNGADTYIRVLNSNGEPVASAFNDNSDGITWIPYPLSGHNYDYYTSEGYIYPPNNQTKLASKIVISPPAGTYYVEITTSPNAPKTAGRYGSYLLSIQ